MLLSLQVSRITCNSTRSRCTHLRLLSTSNIKLPISRRAMLYVPGSNPRMLEKSFDSNADSIAYDLEDSVAPGKKVEARRLISDLLNGENKPKGEIVARINAFGTGFEEDDLRAVLPTKHLQTIALPKTNSPSHIQYLITKINELAPPNKRSNGSNPIKIIAMIESAKAMIEIEQIASSGKGHLDALLFAAEDYCADVGLTRTPIRAELLYPRSKLVTTAKAFGLQAIDLVCVDYKNPNTLREESEEGKRLGFDGKQAIHPNQIDIIHESFSPDEQAILKAARVKFSFEHHDAAGKGAYTLDGMMIDAPVYKQAMKVLAKARSAGLGIPQIRLEDI